MPEKIALPAADQGDDIAVMTVCSANWGLLGLKAAKPFIEPIRLKTLVDAWGFPGTAGAQYEPDYPISEIIEESGYFVVSRPIAQGFSGGPLLLSRQTPYADDRWAADYAVGMIFRSEDKQARAVLIHRVLALINKGNWVPYEDGMRL
jgi:hypothetical protein